MENKEDFKSNTKDMIKKILIVMIIIIVISSVSIFITTTLYNLKNENSISNEGNSKEDNYNSNKNNGNSDDNDIINTEEIKYDGNEYIYKIRYDFGSEVYIYYLKDKSINVVEKIPIAEKVEECNCMELTGEYNYKEHKVSFSSSSINTIVKVFDELAKKSDKKEFNADELELTEYQKETLLAILLNNEEDIPTN